MTNNVSSIKRQFLQILKISTTLSSKCLKKKTYHRNKIIYFGIDFQFTNSKSLMTKKQK